MKLFLVRHGDADADVPEALDDGARALTTRGRAVLLPHFLGLKPYLQGPDIVYMSPLVRTVQTAMVLSEAIGYDGPLRTHRALFPDNPVGAIVALLEQEPDTSTIILVGHQPSMAACAAHLLGLAAFPKPVNPGTVVGMHGTAGGSEPWRLTLYGPVGQPATHSVLGHG